MKPKNLVLRNRKHLAHGNYVRKASPDTDYWFGIDESQIKKLIAKHGTHFFLVIAGAKDDATDFFIIPYIQVKPLLTRQIATISHDGRRRWYAKVRHGQLIVNNQTKRKLDVVCGNVTALVTAMLSLDKCRTMIATMVASPPIGLFEGAELDFG